jgi:hypothetical protein
MMRPVGDGSTVREPVISGFSRARCQNGSCGGGIATTAADKQRTQLLQLLLL